jgi:putative CocE/NonD family hydrolase
MHIAYYVRYKFGHKGRAVQLARSMRICGDTHLPDDEIHVKKFMCGIAVFALWYCFGFTETLPAGEPASSFGQYRPPPLYSEAVTTSQYVTMRDGVRLAVSITRPSQNGKPVAGRFPVLWQHTLAIAAPGILTSRTAGALRNGYGAVPALAYHGYVVVQAARRGQGPSFGKRRGYNDRSEAYDAYEVIDWLASQPWSTGAVGIYGCSNTGDASMHAVTAANPRLKAAWAGCFSWEKYDGFWRGGIYANWGTGPERTLEQDMANTPVQGDEAKVLLHQAAEEHQGSTVLTQMWSAMPFRDDYAPGVGSRFWYEGSVASYLPQINASGTAIYIQGGWRDDLRSQGLLAYANLKNERHVVIGPWGHCQNGDFDMLAEMHRFFDQHLKGINTGILTQAPIHYYTVNAPAGTEWRSSNSWPIAGMQLIKFFLAGNSPAGGELKAQAPIGAGSQTRFTVRYDVDCPSLAGQPGGLLTGAPPCPVEHGGPRFITAPLESDTEVTGDAVADLWMSSSADDGNIFVYLEDVAPDGKITQVTDARLKASLRKMSKPRYENYGLPYHRSHREDAQPLKPGEPAQLVFAFLPESYIYKAGHQIRISVAGSDYRERDRTPVSPAPVVTIYNTPSNPSSISLPVINPKGEYGRKKGEN